MKDPDREFPQRSTRRLFVFEVHKKLVYLASYLGFGNTITALADGLNIARKTLDDAAKSGGCTKELHMQLQVAISQRGRSFDPDWVEWRDPNANEATHRHARSDTLENFEEKWRKENAQRAQKVSGGTGAA